MLFIAIGANLPWAGRPPVATCNMAVAQLSTLPGLVLRAVSGWYLSAPMPPSGQPPYVNGVAALDGDMPPGELLDRLHAIEASLGRKRGEIDGARTLDLDLIDLHGLVRDAPDPILPHPRAHLRAFVLLGLRDVAPGWIHPVSRQDVDALIAALPPQNIRRLQV